MKILICGDRYWRDKEAIAESLSLLADSNTVVIHGGAQGADSLGGEAAKEFGLEVIVVPAEWDRYGKAAGPIRNRKMLDMEPDVVLAFHSDLKKSKGTKDCVKEAEKRDIMTFVIA